MGLALLAFIPQNVWKGPSSQVCVTLSRIQPAFSLSLSPGPCWGGTCELLLNSSRLRGEPMHPPHERRGQAPRQGLQSSWGMLPPDPPGAQGAEPGLGAVGM